MKKLNITLILIAIIALFSITGCQLETKETRIARAEGQLEEILNQIEEIDIDELLFSSTNKPDIVKEQLKSIIESFNEINLDIITSRTTEEIEIIKSYIKDFEGVLISLEIFENFKETGIISYNLDEDMTIQDVITLGWLVQLLTEEIEVIKEDDLNLIYKNFTKFTDGFKDSQNIEINTIFEFYLFTSCVLETMMTGEFTENYKVYVDMIDFAFNNWIKLDSEKMMWDPLGKKEEYIDTMEALSLIHI